MPQHATACAPLCTSSSMARTAPAMAVHDLSEDVSNLLAWGRHTLRSQRAQRREHHVVQRNETHTCRSAELQPPRAMEEAVTALFPDPAWRFRSSQPLRSLLESIDSEKPLEGTAVPRSSRSSSSASTVAQARMRLAQLEERAAANAHTFERRWALLTRGLERLRSQRREREQGRPSSRTRELRRLAAAAQAIVEGEESLAEVLHGIAQRLADVHTQQQPSEQQLDAPALSPSRRPPAQAGLVNSRAQDADEGSPERTLEGTQERVEVDASTPLRCAVDAVVRDVRRLVDTHHSVMEARRRQHATAKERQRQRSARERLLRERLERSTAELDTSKRAEARERAELANAQARRAADEGARALRRASDARRRATKQALDRLGVLTTQAQQQNSIACEELATSEARQRELQMAHHAAVHEERVAEEAHAAAQLKYRSMARRQAKLLREAGEAEAALRGTQDAIEQVRAQRARSAADCAALEDALRERQNTGTHVAPLIFTGGDESVGVDEAEPVGCGSTDAVRTLNSVQEDLSQLEHRAQEQGEQVRSLEQTEVELQRHLRKEQQCVAQLRRHRAALEQNLVLPRSPTAMSAWGAGPPTATEQD